MSKYILFIEMYCFIYSLFSVFSSNHKEDINENPDLVKFTFLNNGKTLCNEDGVLVQQIEDNGQIFDIDVLFEMSTNDYKGKNFRLITNSYIDYKYDDVEGNVSTDDICSRYNLKENMLKKCYSDFYSIILYVKLKESYLIENLEKILERKRYCFQIFIEQKIGDDYVVVNKNNYVFVCYLTDNYCQNLKEKYKNVNKNVEKNQNKKDNNIKNNSENNIESENNIVKSDENKKLIEKEEINTDNIIIESENNENNQNIENKEKLNDENDKCDKKIDDEIKEIYKEEVKNNEILHYLNTENKNYLNKSEEIKKRSLKNKDFFYKEKELNNKINSNINEKLNNIDNEIKNDEFLNNSSGKKCCKNKKSKKITKKKCCKK